MVIGKGCGTPDMTGRSKYMKEIRPDHDHRLCGRKREARAGSFAEERIIGDGEVPVSRKILIAYFSMKGGALEGMRIVHREKGQAHEIME